nr:homologous-pairing protein 2 [Quercus suber]
MAPKKEEKEAKLNADQSAALILDYLRKQNRPYSATDISANLKNRVTKTAAAKLLKDMHERRDIEGRAAGKQIVYHAIQDEADEVGAESLQVMDAEIARLKDCVVALRTEEKELRLSLRDGTAQVPLPQLKMAVSALEAEEAAMRSRLADLKSGSLVPVSAEEMNQVLVEWKKWSKIAVERRKIRTMLWETIAENLEKKEAQELKDRLGLEL